MNYKSNIALMKKGFKIKDLFMWVPTFCIFIYKSYVLLSLQHLFLWKQLLNNAANINCGLKHIKSGVKKYALIYFKYVSPKKRE